MLFMTILSYVSALVSESDSLKGRFICIWIPQVKTNNWNDYEN
jgi:hypothetical protein